MLVVELKRVDDVGFCLEEENRRPHFELVDDYADKLETIQLHWAELAQDINWDKLEGLRDVVFRVFRVRLLRAFSEGEDVARLQFARKLDTVAQHTLKNVQVPAVDVSNATVPEISRLRTRGHSGGAVTVGKGEFERVKLLRDRRRWELECFSYLHSRPISIEDGGDTLARRRQNRQEVPSKARLRKLKR